MARLVPGIGEYDDRRTVSQSLEELARWMTDTRILFEQGVGAPLSPEQYQEIRRLSDLLRQLDELARLSNTTVTVHIIGQTDAVGRLRQNRRLSEIRAQSVLDAIRPSAFTMVTLHANGIGPAAATDTQDRRVSFQVTVQPARETSPE